ncbi:Wzz/FepE/Etk N-terminal domain-containing protein [Pedobacter sp. SL55]|uniref:Wzz/FepE/Etk N-terminal domain-containing protein n=1 Tax=Pedobacter sp. SL55 TaxID=2995161 RepID=UPI00226EA8E7|nr:Wzz/FepE/Etk N-terminal domain-containing protein [Pedobacter sp. SL55]WAC41458.1 Wzz/FepE/Etk N-terminal domain-containing protein [Pedobacter sp. SL55]
MTNDLEKNKNIQEDEISLKELILKIREWWQYLWSKKWIIIAAGLVGALLGLGYSFTKKPIYTATTTFVLESGEKSGGGLGAYAGVASMMGIDLGGGGGDMFQGDNILDFYKSRKMIEKALFSPVDTGSNQPLIEKYIEINELRKVWGENEQLIKLKFKVGDFELVKRDRLRDSVVGSIVEDIGKNYLSVAKPDKKLSKIQVDVKSTNEVFAKRFNEEIVENVNDFYVETKTKKSLANVAILQRKTDSVRAVMNGAIYNAAAVSDATPNMNPTRQVQRVAPIQRAQASAETNKAILSSLIQNLEMSKMALMKEAPLLQIVDGPIYPLQKEKFGKAKGIVLGGIFVVFITLLILTGRYFINKILN